MAVAEGVTICREACMTPRLEFQTSWPVSTAMIDAIYKAKVTTPMHAHCAVASTFSLLSKYFANFSSMEELLECTPELGALHYLGILYVNRGYKESVDAWEISRCNVVEILKKRDGWPMLDCIEECLDAVLGEGAPDELLDRFVESHEYSGGLQYTTTTRHLAHAVSNAILRHTDSKTTESALLARRVVLLLQELGKEHKQIDLDQYCESIKRASHSLEFTSSHVWCLEKQLENYAKQANPDRLVIASLEKSIEEARKASGFSVRGIALKEHVVLEDETKKTVEELLIMQYNGDLQRDYRLSHFVQARCALNEALDSKLLRSQAAMAEIAFRASRTELLSPLTKQDSFEGGAFWKSQPAREKISILS